VFVTEGRSLRPAEGVVFEWFLPARWELSERCLLCAGVMKGCSLHKSAQVIKNRLNSRC
jgi:hypothetical protein